MKSSLGQSRPEGALTRPPTQGGNGKPKLLPTVFVSELPLSEQMAHASLRIAPSSVLSVLSDGISKKRDELEGELHTLKFSPIKASPFTVQEAESVLRQADRMLAALPSEQSQARSGISHDELMKAYDLFITLDAAVRALRVP